VHNSDIIFQTCASPVAWVYQKVPTESSTSCPVAGHSGQQPTKTVPPHGAPLSVRFWKGIFPPPASHFFSVTPGHK